MRNDNPFKNAIEEHAARPVAEDGEYSVEDVYRSWEAWITWGNQEISWESDDVQEAYAFIRAQLDAYPEPPRDPAEDQTCDSCQ